MLGVRRRDDDRLHGDDRRRLRRSRAGNSGGSGAVLVRIVGVGALLTARRFRGFRLVVPDTAARRDACRGATVERGRPVGLATAGPVDGAPVDANAGATAVGGAPFDANAGAAAVDGTASIESRRDSPAADDTGCGALDVIERRIRAFAYGSIERRIRIVAATATHRRILRAAAGAASRRARCPVGAASDIRCAIERIRWCHSSQRAPAAAANAPCAHPGRGSRASGASGEPWFGIADVGRLVRTIPGIRESPGRCVAREAGGRASASVRSAGDDRSHRPAWRRSAATGASGRISGCRSFAATIERPAATISPDARSAGGASVGPCRPECRCGQGRAAVSVAADGVEHDANCTGADAHGGSPGIPRTACRRSG